MNGDVYSANIADVLPEYDEVDVETEEEITAVKRQNVKNAVEIVFTYVYPYHLGFGDGLDSGLYALTYDGIMYRLNQWIDI